MAEVTSIIGYSHTPYLFSRPSLWPQIRDRIRKGKPVRDDLPPERPDELESKYQRSLAAFSKLGELVRRSGSEAMVIVGDDQKEMFSSMVAGITIYTGKQVEGKRFPGRVREVTGNQERISISNHRSLAEEILSGLAKEDFDITFFDEPENPEKKADGFGHAFLPPLAYLTPGLDLPVVPLLLNCYYPPQPTPRRCYHLGQSLRKVLKSAKAVKRVMVAVSGGLWHTPGKEDATIDESFDRFFLASLESGNGRVLAEMSEENLVSGTGEVRNWIVGAGIAGERKWSVLDYIPLYYSPIGLGFAVCQMDEG